MEYLLRARQLGFRVAEIKGNKKTYELRKNNNFVCFCSPAELPYRLIHEMEKAGVRVKSGVVES